MMAWPTIIFGSVLVMLGATSYVNGKPSETTGVVSPTSLIPAGFGVVLVLCGLLAFSEKLRKHAMHAAAMVGLLGALGGLVPAIRQASKPDVAFDPNAPAVRSGLLMTIVCTVFVVMCVKSFIDARRLKRRQELLGLGV